MSPNLLTRQIIKIQMAYFRRKKNRRRAISATCIPRLAGSLEKFKSLQIILLQDVSVIQPKRKSRKTRSKRLSKKNSRKCSIGETRKLRDEASSTRILSSDRDDSEEVINKIDNYDFERIVP